MRNHLCAVALAFACVATAASAEPVELGPNGGRLLAFDPDRSGFAEVTEADGAFHVELLDRDLQPVLLNKQALTAIGGDRTKPARLPVEIKANRFVTPVPAGEEVWMLLQIRPAPGARKFRLRFHYDVTACPECGKPRWLCACDPE